ncbi:hypothetical protein HOG48_01085 [Candidatus Peregrinibacteria bacterium]|jgi:hypothetical protein|nr:hypothetical protein [Candidatus Peregrinibacteria bacterium]
MTDQEEQPEASWEELVAKAETLDKLKDGLILSGGEIPQSCANAMRELREKLLLILSGEGALTYKKTGILPGNAFDKMKGRDGFKRDLERLSQQIESNLPEILIAIRKGDKDEMKEWLETLKIPIYDPADVAEVMAKWVQDNPEHELSQGGILKEEVGFGMLKELQKAEGPFIGPDGKLKKEGRIRQSVEGTKGVKAREEKAIDMKAMEWAKGFFFADTMSVLALAVTFAVIPAALVPAIGILTGCLFGAVVLPTAGMYGWSESSRKEFLKLIHGLKHVQKGNVPEEVRDQFPGGEFNDEAWGLNKSIAEIQELPDPETLAELLSTRIKLLGYIKASRTVAAEEKAAAKLSEEKEAAETFAEAEKAAREIGMVLGREDSPFRRALKGIAASTKAEQELNRTERGDEQVRQRGSRGRQSV